MAHFARLGVGDVVVKVHVVSNNVATSEQAGVEFLQNLYKTRDIFIVLNSTVPCTYKHPEWGFPKGRPNHGEDPFDCASRELYEETRINKYSYDIVPSILPFEERYVGTNGIGYRNVFFIGKAKSNCVAYLDKKNTAQIREIGYIKWFPYEIAIRQFRDHEESKRCVLEHVNQAIISDYNKVPNSTFY